MILAHCLLLVCAVAILRTMAFGDDPAPPTVEPAILQSVESQFSSEVAKADSEVSKAEGEAAKMKKAAAAVRLKAYKDRLAEVTKSGDFDKAIAVKARIEHLEKEPESSPSRPAKRPRPKDVVRFGGHAYALLKEPATWHVAKQRCEEMGGHLAIVTSEAEFAFLMSVCKRAGTSAWIGATDEENEGKWKWVDGTDAKFNSVHVSNSDGNEQYMRIDTTLSDYNDAASSRVPYICEWDR